MNPHRQNSANREHCRFVKRGSDHFNGVSNAVVGYTDALVAKMFSRDGVPVPTADSFSEMIDSLHRLEAELRFLTERSAG